MKMKNDLKISPTTPHEGRIHESFTPFILI